MNPNDEQKGPPSDTKESSSSLFTAPIPKKKRPSPTQEETSATTAGTISTSNDDTITAGLPMIPIPRKPKGGEVTNVMTSKPLKRSHQDMEASLSVSSSSFTQQPSSTVAKAKAAAAAETVSHHNDPSSVEPKPKRHYIRVLNENPIILCIKTTGVPLTEGISKNNNTRAVRQARQATKVQYEEAQLTDSDDFLTNSDDDDDDDAAVGPARSTTTSSSSKSRPKKRKSTVVGQSNASTSVDYEATTEPMLLYNPAETGPPEGMLSTLWYSNEVFLNIYVMEKILGYKVRPVVHLVTTANDNGEEEPYLMDHKTAVQWQEKALQATPAVWNDTATRMAISRANPSRCPTLLTVAAQAEAQQAAKEGRPPRFVLRTSPTVETEEVLLVKWRGRSHWHCSWERPVDIINVDAGNNNIVKQKLKRYYQSQELAFGVHWKQILADENANAAAHGVDVGHASPSGDEYFPPQCLEVERILECDETEMNMEVLAVQRAKNAALEEDPPRLDKSALLDSIVNAPEVADVWDPEDNVRYVVKWKGLPYAEMTWEYWRDIKRDAVDHAEDFWLRQQPPSAEEIRGAIMTPHPSMRDFKKLKESPEYGLSSQKRPMAKLFGQSSASPAPEEEGSGTEALKLRSYQLEGLNWLLFNWWNKRSCILADEMGLGRWHSSLGRFVV
jgi:hypothetical protein